MRLIIMKNLNLILLSVFLGFGFSENINTKQNSDEALTQMFQAVWLEAMNAKNIVNIATPQIREEAVEQFMWIYWTISKQFTSSNLLTITYHHIASKKNWIFTNRIISFYHCYQN